MQGRINPLNQAIREGQPLESIQKLLEEKPELVDERTINCALLRENPILVELLLERDPLPFNNDSLNCLLIYCNRVKLISDVNALIAKFSTALERGWELNEDSFQCAELWGIFLVVNQISSLLQNKSISKSTRTIAQIGKDLWSEYGLFPNVLLLEEKKPEAALEEKIAKRAEEPSQHRPIVIPISPEEAKQMPPIALPPPPEVFDRAFLVALGNVLIDQRLNFLIPSVRTSLRNPAIYSDMLYDIGCYFIKILGGHRSPDGYLPRLPETVYLSIINALEIDLTRIFEISAPVESKLASRPEQLRELKEVYEHQKRRLTYDQLILAIAPLSRQGNISDIDSLRLIEDFSLIIDALGKYNNDLAMHWVPIIQGELNDFRKKIKKIAEHENSSRAVLYGTERLASLSSLLFVEEMQRQGIYRPARTAPGATPASGSIVSSRAAISSSGSSAAEAVPEVKATSSSTITTSSFAAQPASGHSPPPPKRRAVSVTGLATQGLFTSPELSAVQPRAVSTADRASIMTKRLNEIIDLDAYERSLTDTEPLTQEDEANLKYLQEHADQSLQEIYNRGVMPRLRNILSGIEDEPGIFLMEREPCLAALGRRVAELEQQEKQAQKAQKDSSPPRPTHRRGRSSPTSF